METFYVKKAENRIFSLRNFSLSYKMECSALSFEDAFEELSDELSIASLELSEEQMEGREFSKDSKVKLGQLSD